MDITGLVVSGREQALLYGDHFTYQAALGRRLLSCRKKLDIVTKNRGKFHVKKEITADEIAANPEYVYLGILTSERAWAHAMGIKTQHATDTKGLTGKARTHIISRLHRASSFAQQVSAGLSARDGGLSTEVLEALAYSHMIQATEYFERHKWETALSHYAVTRCIYSALLVQTKSDTFKDLIFETLDPNIRYAAYQLKVPRTLPIDTIVRKYFPVANNEALVAKITSIDASILNTSKASSTDADADMAGTDSSADSTDEIPKTISWRSREVPIEDGAIAQAWGRVQASKSALPTLISAALPPRDQAAAYDDILAATQDAVDATKQAIDELRGEGVPSSDPRMQALQITRTAVNYEMISWQIGRNRVLTGDADGANEDYSELSRRQLKKLRAAASTASSTSPDVKQEKEGRKLTKLKERVALYDGILRSLDQIRDLPGVAADESLASRLATFGAYFTSLKALAIARSHALTGANTNALALLDYALAQMSSPEVAALKAEDSPMHNSAVSTSPPPDITVLPTQISALHSLLQAQVLRFRALVHIDALRAEAITEATGSPDIDSVELSGLDAHATKLPLVETLGEYPAAGADLHNLVTYPPRPTLVPVKPIFLDVAWNYIDYPGREASVAVANNEESQPEQKKKGWFGFGR
ncbi:Signal recognition particle subunit SRP68 [Ceratocystis fimbriata CBS 114723]|uniref:Signal recognition particle subunit SRP68 n=1 Tax=Ceratocystis fimbriata CBS 114723 TaxID=1035309 RepID=A0A2C5X9W6_9PEZI|nr:Signal recognition particle subunit SRP68 [Ceratocystis fimbriata CBS 114723]